MAKLLFADIKKLVIDKGYEVVKKSSGGYKVGEKFFKNLTVLKEWIDTIKTPEQNKGIREVIAELKDDEHVIEIETITLESGVTIEIDSSSVLPSVIIDEIIFAPPAQSDRTADQSLSSVSYRYNGYSIYLWSKKAPSGDLLFRTSINNFYADNNYVSDWTFFQPLALSWAYCAVDDQVSDKKLGLASEVSVETWQKINSISRVVKQEVMQGINAKKKA